LLSVDEAIKSDLKITYKDKIVEQVHLIIVTIQNSGKAPLKKIDFDRQISLVFNKDASILSAEISSTKPDSLEVQTSIEGQQVLLEPCLMNAGDLITLKIIVTKYDGTFSIKGRLVGVKEIKEFGSRSLASIIWNTAFTILGIIIMAIAGIESSYLNFLFGLATGILIICTGFNFYNQVSFFRKRKQLIRQ
jgi:hypothetical protein